MPFIADPGKFHSTIKITSPISVRRNYAIIEAYDALERAQKAADVKMTPAALETTVNASTTL